MLIQDVRHALRLLVREPGFTMAAVLTLALGVGANVAVFTVVNAALLRPLPYPDADNLVLVQHRDTRTGITKAFIAIGDFVDLRARQRSFESLAAYGTGRQTLFGEGDPFDVAVLQATPDLFEMLRTRPALGRALTADDAKEGAAPVMMLGHELWQQQFKADPAMWDARSGSARSRGGRGHRGAGVRSPPARATRESSRCACGALRGTQKADGLGARA